jgi:hypothetical protein
VSTRFCLGGCLPYDLWSAQHMRQLTRQLAISNQAPHFPPCELCVLMSTVAKASLSNSVQSQGMHSGLTLVFGCGPVVRATANMEFAPSNCKRCGTVDKTPNRAYNGPWIRWYYSLSRSSMTQQDKFGRICHLAGANPIVGAVHDRYQLYPEQPSPEHYFHFILPPIWANTMPNKRQMTTS